MLAGTKMSALPVIVSLALSVAGFFASIASSMYLRGKRDAVVETDIEYIKRDVANLMRYFKLTPAEDHNRRQRG